MGLAFEDPISQPSARLEVSRWGGGSFRCAGALWLGWLRRWAHALNLLQCKLHIILISSSSSSSSLSRRPGVVNTGNGALRVCSSFCLPSCLSPSPVEGEDNKWRRERLVGEMRIAPQVLWPDGLRVEAGVGEPWEETARSTRKAKTQKAPTWHRRVRAQRSRRCPVQAGNRPGDWDCNRCGFNN